LRKTKLGAVQATVPAPDELHCADLPDCRDVLEREPSGAGLQMSPLTSAERSNHVLRDQKLW